MERKTISIDEYLNQAGIAALNSMQQDAFTAISENDEVILLSPTGTGKTLAYLLPLLQFLDEKKRTTQALIIVPSRELVLQIEKVFKSLGSGIKVTACYGGHKREIEENNLIEAPALIIGTPGRLGDHIRRENIRTSNIHTLILDEFDKSLELGFQDEMAFVIQSLPSVRKRILISATDMEGIPSFTGIHEPVKLHFESDHKDAGNKLDVQYVKSEEKDKSETLFRLLCSVGGRSAIVFCNHREAVERTSRLLAEKGIPNVFYHGSMEQHERDSALSKFRNGSSYVLVTTDLASRGLDIPNIRYIIHYHLPHTEESYTHRNGRTARMDASGTVILILSEEENIPEYVQPDISQIQLPETVILPEKPKWVTIFFAAGKKNKVNKVDIVGFLTQKGQLKKEDIGLIDVKDFSSFVAIRKSKTAHTLHLIEGQKIKNMKVKMAIAK